MVSIGICTSVPTGNFGDILAGKYSKFMGLPVGKVVIVVVWRRMKMISCIDSSPRVNIAANQSPNACAATAPRICPLGMNDFESTNTLEVTVIGAFAPQGAN
jgi:hypothetical protein